VPKKRKVVYNKGMKIERIDNLPIVNYSLKQMKVAEIIDQLWLRPVKWKGLSIGQLAVLFLLYVITTRNHRLSAMEEWVEEHRVTLEKITGWEIGKKDATDDRLGYLLGELGEKERKMEEYYRKGGQQIIRGYQLKTEVGRFDTTSFNVYHSPEDERKGILKFGYSKDKRPDLLQFKQSLGTLDPAGVPIFSQTLAGNEADDRLYVKAWREMSQTIGHKDFLFVGDSKGGSEETRTKIAQEGGYYLFPLAMTGKRKKELEALVLKQARQASKIELVDKTGKLSVVGQGFKSSNPQKDKETWYVTQSQAFAKGQQKALLARLDKAEEQLKNLKAKSGETKIAFEQRALQILKQYKVSALLTISLNESSTLSKKFIGQGRPGPNRPYCFVSEITLVLTVTRQQTAIDKALHLCGWRIYATNFSGLSLTDVTKYYRGQWSNERGYHRFKRGDIPALPLFLRLPQRIRGLMFLLTIALQLLTVIEFVVQRELAVQETKIAGLVPGNPKMETARPSAERILTQFKSIHLLILEDNQHRFEPLTTMQRNLLALMNMPETIYDF